VTAVTYPHSGFRKNTYRRGTSTPSHESLIWGFQLN